MKRTIPVTALSRLRSCPRMVALTQFGDSNNRLPHTHSRAMLGTIYHDFLESVVRGAAGDPPDFFAVWNKAVKNFERDNRETPNKCWLPISSTMPDLERFRIRAFRTAQNMQSTSIPSRSVPSQKSNRSQATPRLRGPEVPVRFDVGGWALTGKIDQVIEVSGRLTIVDYKTGAVCDDQGRIKTEYVEQLQLYAGMLNSMSGGGRAVVLEIIDKNSCTYSIPADWNQINDLMSGASQLIEDFASNWPENPQTDADILAAYPRSAIGDTTFASAVRHRCDVHRGSMKRDGRVALGRIEREFETTDIYGRVESASSCTLGWAIRLGTPRGKIHLRGPMPRKPEIGDCVYAFGVEPGPANPAPSPEAANDFVVPRWGVVQIESDLNPLINWPDRPIHVVASKDAEARDREIRPGDICLLVCGHSHVDRIIFDDGTWQSTRSVEAVDMPPHYLAYTAALLEIKSIVDASIGGNQMIWCRTPQASQWLEKIPISSLKKLREEEPWAKVFGELRLWWQELQTNCSVAIVTEKNLPRFSNRPVTTVFIDGEPIARVAVPSEALPQSIANVGVMREPIVANTVVVPSTLAVSEPLITPASSVDIANKIDTDPDFEVSAHVVGSRGPGNVIMNACSDRGQESGLANCIQSTGSSVNALALLGILVLAKGVVESELMYVRVRCRNDTAVSWFGTQAKKAISANNDSEISGRIHKLYCWLRELFMDELYSIESVKKNPQNGVRPSVTIKNGGNVIVTISS